MQKQLLNSPTDGHKVTDRYNRNAARLLTSVDSATTGTRYDDIRMDAASGSGITTRDTRITPTWSEKKTSSCGW